MAALALGRADVAAFETRTIILEERLDARLRRVELPHLVVEPVEPVANHRIILHVLIQHVTLDSRGSDPPLSIETQPRAAEPVVSQRRVENQRSPEESRRIFLAQFPPAGRLVEAGGIAV